MRKKISIRIYTIQSTTKIKEKYYDLRLKYLPLANSIWFENIWSHSILHYKV
jgi:hypothetical protein